MARAIFQPLVCGILPDIFHFFFQLCGMLYDVLESSRPPTQHLDVAESG
jgi:hypothetical protein